MAPFSVEEKDVLSVLVKAKILEGIILLTWGALHEQYGSYTSGVPEQSWVGADRSMSLDISHNCHPAQGTDV